jgi:hypothetical protein
MSINNFVTKFPNRTNILSEMLIPGNQYIIELIILEGELDERKINPKPEDHPEVVIGKFKYFEKDDIRLPNFESVVDLKNGEEISNCAWYPSNRVKFYEVNPEILKEIKIINNKNAILMLFLSEAKHYFEDLSDSYNESNRFKNYKSFVRHNKNCIMNMSEDDALFYAKICSKINNEEILLVDAENFSSWQACWIYFDKNNCINIVHPR